MGNEQKRREEKELARHYRRQAVEVATVLARFDPASLGFSDNPDIEAEYAAEATEIVRRIRHDGVAELENVVAAVLQTSLDLAVTPADLDSLAEALRAVLCAPSSGIEEPADY